jgi:hypothetical protein
MAKETHEFNAHIQSHLATIVQSSDDAIISKFIFK